MSEERIYLHAELACLIKAKKPVHTLLVQRFKADGSYALAKPCASCYAAINAFGVKKLIYSTEQGLVTEYLEN